MIINQTHIYPVNYPADLMVIRMACLNQILDPWVYILFRKEFLFQILNFLKWIFCLKKEAIVDHRQNQKNANEVNQNTETLVNKSGYKCLACFCGERTGNKLKRKLSLFSYIATANGSFHNKSPKDSGSSESNSRHLNNHCLNMIPKQESPENGVDQEFHNERQDYMNAHESLLIPAMDGDIAFIRSDTNINALE